MNPDEYARCTRRWHHWYTVARIGATGLIAFAVTAIVLVVIGNPLWVPVWITAALCGVVGTGGYAGMVSTNKQLLQLAKCQQ